MIYNSIKDLHAAYESGATSPREYLYACLETVKSDNHNCFISVASKEQLEAFLLELEARDHSDPLWGVPFAVKDNIDVLGFKTTAACPAYAYEASSNAFAVDCLIKRGAVPLGKTNLDQFATGLVGVRSPYGAVKNSINREYISGGSSSGSAVAVALGEVLFSLGTDTAGSGRVPAAFNNIIGVKGTCGRVSTSGVVPACRSLDCVTVFAKSLEDASIAWQAMAVFDEKDPFARSSTVLEPVKAGFSFGVPDKLDFLEDEEAQLLYEQAIEKFKSLGGHEIKFKLDPFLKAAKLLYESAFVSERLAGLEAFFTEQEEACLPVIRTIIGGGRGFSSLDLYNTQYKLAALKREAELELKKCDFAVLPTAATIYRIAEVEANPIELNSRLGLYTNFMNLLDYAALALPAGFRSKGPKEGLPFGITLFKQAFGDEALMQIGRLYIEGTSEKLAKTEDTELARTSLAVVGAHLTGMPLNYQLLERGARLIKTTKTAASYKLFKLSGSKVPKPGLARVANEQKGRSYTVELYSMPINQLGSFLALIPAPLGLGQVQLVDGSSVLGFICEGYALEEATDISEFAGWKEYLESC